MFVLNRRSPGLFLLLCLAVPASPASGEPKPEDLRDLRGEIADSEARKKDYEEQIGALGDETRKLRRRLVAVTARVMEKERAVGEAEANLEALEAREAAAQVDFEAKSEALVETIAALQILQKNPPPALLVKPDDALDAARSAILLSEIAPHLKAEADALAFKLSELRLIRDAVEVQRDELLKADKELAKERKSLQGMLAERENMYSALSVRASMERQKLARLAEKARNLEQLLAALKAVAPTFPRAKPDMPPQMAALPQPRPGLPSKPEEVTLSDGFETALISKARGNLRPPALGRIVGQYNRPDGSGGHSKGITIATQPQAQVIAPFDGKIVFAGPLPGYGELLIIEAGEGYHLVLSGMVRIDGVVGQRLLAGEPVGQMGGLARIGGETSAGETKDFGGKQEATRAASTLSASAREAAKPHLYFEMRRNGKPFDPQPWLTNGQRKVRG